MKSYIFFIFLLFILPTPVNAGVQRSTQISDVMWNGSFVYKSIEVTLTPDNYNNFDIPGYGVTEYLPSGLSLISTNADWHSLEDRKLSMVRVLPPANNYSLRYTLKIPLHVSNTTYTFYGTYKDENKNTGEITSTDMKYVPSSSSSSTTPTPTPQKTYLIPTPTVTPSSSKITDVTPPTEIKIKSINETAEEFNTATDNSSSLLLLLIPLLAGIIGIRYIKNKQPSDKNIIMPVKILANTSDIFINYKLMPFPVKLEVKNTSDKTIFPKIKIKGDSPIYVYPSLIVIPPQSEGFFNITSQLIKSSKDYSGEIKITWNGKK